MSRFGLGGRGSQFLGLESSEPFSPEQYSDLGLWLVAENMGLSNGAAVAAWDDESGNNRDFAQSDGGFKPTYETGAVNGLAAVSFSSDYMTHTGYSYANTSGSDMSLFIVVEASSGGAISTRRGSTGWTLRPRSAFFLTGGTPNVTLDMGTGWHVVSIMRDGLSVTPYVDGVAGTGQTVSAFTANGTPQTHIGGDDSAGGGNPTNQPLAGKIAEVLIYERLLSGAEQDVVEGYLMDRYGL